jgi:hypothetical protein
MAHSELKQVQDECARKVAEAVRAAAEDRRAADELRAKTAELDGRARQYATMYETLSKEAEALRVENRKTKEAVAKALGEP